MLPLLVRMSLGGSVVVYEIHTRMTLEERTVELSQDSMAAAAVIAYAGLDPEEDQPSKVATECALMSANQFELRT